MTAPITSESGTALRAPRQPRKRRKTLRTSSAWVPYAFLAPTIAAIILGFVVPALDIIRQSTSDGTIASEGEFVGLGNYVEIIGDPEFWNSLRVTGLYAIGTMIGTLALGLLVAILLNRPFKGRGALRTLLIIPWAMPLFPVALIWQWTLDPQYGILRSIWAALGGTFPGLLTDPAWALPAVIAIQIWRYVPFAGLMFLAGLQSVPVELYEAAKTDGAGVFRSFLNVTLPGVKHITTVLALLIAIWSFGTAMTIVYLLTHGGPAGSTELLSLLAYTNAFDEYKFGVAATLGTIVLIISSIFAGIYLYVTRRRDG